MIKAMKNLFIFIYFFSETVAANFAISVAPMNNVVAIRLMSFSQNSSVSLTRLAKCLCYYGAKKKLFRSAELFRLCFHSSGGSQGINVFLGNGNGIELGKLVDELARDHGVL